MSRRIGSTFAGVLALACLGWGAACAAAEPLPSLDDLLKEYQALGLPLPPKEAKLVRLEAESAEEGKAQAKVYLLVFQIKPGTDTENPVILWGFHELQPFWKSQAQEVKPEPAAAKDVDMGSADALALAIQCHARGWDNLAQHLLERSQKKAKLPPRNELIQQAWYHWKDHLTRPKIDRAPVAKRLKELIERDKELDTESNRALLKSLELALVPSKAKPGSVEALIDDLVDYNANTGGMGFFEPGERYWRIAELGFDAVPALIEHLDDDRLTRAEMEGFNNFRSWHLRIRDVVGDLLEGLAGHSIGRGWLRRQQGYAVEKAEAQKWWDEARKVGEETYVLDWVFLPRLKEGWPGQVSPHLLAVIQAKYPKRVPSLYKTILDERPEVDSRMLAGAVFRGKLPDKEKLNLFRHAAEHKDFGHRLPALQALKELDKTQYVPLLLATIESLPEDVPGEYWKCPEADFASLVLKSDDPRIWQAFEKAAQRASVGLRMELLANYFVPEDNSKQRQEGLRLLSRFLDDVTLRDVGTSKKFDGPSAGSEYRRLEVRNFAALKLASLLGVKVEQNPESTPEEWAKVRSQVQEALKRERDQKK